MYFGRYDIFFVKKFSDGMMRMHFDSLSLLIDNGFQTIFNRRVAKRDD